jgi:short-subunit dehydrogenase
MKKQVLIIGANSEIGYSCAEEYLKQGCELILAAHKPEELAPLEAKVIQVDVTNQAEALETLAEIDCDIVLYAAGKMVENDQALFSEAGQLVRDVNYNGAVAILGHFAEKFAKKEAGVIVGISSVAADRGKSSNVVYGSAKAGFDSFLAGLRQYLHSFGVRVLTVRPGYVSTKMTAGLDLPKKLTATKEQVARKIVKHSLSGSRNIVYVLPIWRPIMWTLKQIPERIFKRKKL